jgi:hypothetical protein
MKHSGLIRKRASSQTNTTTTKKPLMLKGSNTSGSSFIMRTHPRTDIDLFCISTSIEIPSFIFQHMTKAKNVEKFDHSAQRFPSG